MGHSGTERDQREGVVGRADNLGKELLSGFNLRDSPTRSEFHKGLFGVSGPVREGAVRQSCSQGKHLGDYCKSFYRGHDARNKGSGIRNEDKAGVLSAHHWG